MTLIGIQSRKTFLIRTLVFSLYFLCFQVGTVNAKEIGIPPEDIKNIGVKFASLLNDSNHKGLTLLFDTDVFSERTARTMGISESGIPTFKAGFRKSINQELLAQMLGKMSEEQDTVTYQGLYKKTHALLRVVGVEGGINYLELLITKKDSSYIVSDIYILTSGDYLSTTVGAIAKLLVEPNKSLLKKLFGENTQVNQSLINKMKTMGEMINTQQYAAAIEFYESFPDNLKTSLPMMKMITNISSYLTDEDVYRKRLSMLATQHGNEASISMLLIDHYLYEENYESALSALDNIIERYGKDGSLLELKAYIIDLANPNDSKTEDLFIEAISIEPEYEDVYWSLMNYYNDQERFVLMPSLFEKLENDFGYTFTNEDFSDDSYYQKFHQSKAFSDWKLKK